ncbi:hypothetical protein QUV83_16795 [Cellulomonas cellasea]|uniref:hypothetical protein n=1 Tax=Cellulomonas cellasea TaxID=43670 RepID=UPI0025A37902|nr:hypothetical protein [Cellulomonas cellasea]MDM8086432.1 hypothetical protein [Cellulomonas cellasea]
MTWAVTRPRLLAAAVGMLVALVLVVGSAVSRTTAAWADQASFAAQVSAGSWSGGSGGSGATGDSCEVLSVSTGEVLGACAVEQVHNLGEWPQGMRFAVEISGLVLDGEQQARVTVDMSKAGFTREWDWSAGSVTMDYVADYSWSAPYLTFTTAQWNDGLSFGGTFNLNG